MENKDIDRLFQEKLKDMEVTPNPKVWEAIEEKLQKKKRRILPFWWLSGAGAVASILVLFFLFNTKNELPIITNKTDALPQPINLKIDTLKEVLTAEAKEENRSIENKKTSSTEKNNSVTKEDEKIIVLNNDSSTKQTNSDENYYVTQNNNNSDNDSIKSAKNINQELNNNLLLTDNSPEKKGIIEQPIHDNLYNSKLDEIKPLSENNTTHSNKEVRTDFVNNNDDDPHIKEKSDKSAIKKKDFIAEMNKKDNEIIEESNETKSWKINPVLGVLNSNSFTDDSPIDNSLSFSGDNSFAYGVNVEYALNKKWSLKSGVQLQKSSFSSEQINNISNISVLRSFANIDVDVVRNDNSSDQVVEEEPEVIEIENSLDDQDFEPVILTPNDGGVDNSNDKEESLKQRYSYIEIPIETKYTFYNKPKTQISLVSGFSTLVLSENKILTVVDGAEETVGELTNLNTLNFSGNLGIDIDFLILDKIHFNINPMFKSQLNTFTTNSTNFQPYIIGLYSGLKYQF